MGVKTDALNPKLTKTPWITTNDVYDNTNAYKVESDLLDFVCKNYTGSNKSSSCN
jgi:hypothetical protein